MLTDADVADPDHTIYFDSDPDPDINFIGRF